jgi:predicted transcriptional regulator|tara:strand:+ start:2086 stop:2280 length:195 start_codon:yes stop_codon:yes gene_type:complete
MKQHTVWLSDETTEVVEGLAAKLTDGNFSAMIREVVNKTVLRQDCEVYQRKLEAMIRAKEQPCK